MPVRTNSRQHVADIWIAVNDALQKIGKAWIKRIIAIDRGKRPRPADNGVHTVTLAAPASVAADVVVTLPGTAGTLLRAEDIASGTITARADDINFSGGSDGDVLITLSTYS